MTSTWRHLPAHEVHAWSFSLETTAEESRQLESMLGDDERARAARFVFEVDRRRFVAGRARVRRILGGYLGREAERLRFVAGEAGKPALADAPLEFNFSNSHARGLLALSTAGAVGADIEVHRELTDLEALARRHFSATECANLLALPPEQRQAAFYDCWTRKESMVKALGGGLSIPLDGFEVEFRPGAPAALLSVRASTEEARRWTLWNVDLGPGVSAAVIVGATNASLRLFDGA